MIINVDRLKLGNFEIAINRCCLFFAFCCCYIGYVMPSCPLIFSPQIKKKLQIQISVNILPLPVFNHFTCILYTILLYELSSVLVHFALEKMYIRLI